MAATFTIYNAADDSQLLTGDYADEDFWCDYALDQLTIAKPWKVYVTKLDNEGNTVNVGTFYSEVEDLRRAFPGLDHYDDDVLACWDLAARFRPRTTEMRQLICAHLLEEDKGMASWIEAGDLGESRGIGPPVYVGSVSNTLAKSTQELLRAGERDTWWMLTMYGARYLEMVRADLRLRQPSPSHVRKARSGDP